MAPRQRAFTPDTLDDIYRQLYDLSEKIRMLQKSPSVIERLNPVTFPDPVEAQVAIDSRTNCLIYYANGAWREKCSAIKNIKVYGDRTTNRVENGAFRFTIEEDLADTLIEQVEVFNGTEGTGLTSAQLQNVTRGIDILSAVQSVPSGAWHSAGDASIDTGGDPDEPNNKVHYKDRMWINTTAIGTGSKGFGMYITFHGLKVDVAP